MDNLYQICNDTASRRKLTRIALAILDSPALAEEVVQEAYLRLLENDEGVIESPLIWLRTVTRNLAIDQARRRMRERELLLLVPGLDLFSPHKSRHDTESRLAELVSCLLHISDSNVTAMILLHVVFGVSYEDIATICGRSPQACRQTGSRALRKCIHVFNSDESYDDAAHTDMYVHAILDASMAPLIKSLDVASPTNAKESATNCLNSYCSNLLSTTSRTRQVLVLTTSGVKWALVLDGMLLCLPGSSTLRASAKLNQQRQLNLTNHRTNRLDMPFVTGKDTID